MLTLQDPTHPINQPGPGKRPEDCWVFPEQLSGNSSHASAGNFLITLERNVGSMTEMSDLVEVGSNLQSTSPSWLPLTATRGASQGPRDISIKDL